MASVHSGRPSCDVCGEPVYQLNHSQIKAQGYAVCHAADCKRIMSQKSLMSPFAFDLQVELKKKLSQDREEAVAAKQKHEDKITAKEAEQNREILQDYLRDNPGLSEKPPYVLPLPSGLRGMRPVPKERISAYTEHLKDIIKQAAAYVSCADIPHNHGHDSNEKLLAVEERLKENPELRTLSDKLCNLCKGGCCPSGKDHAYLSVHGMRGLMDLEPELSQEDLLNLYLARIQPETIEGACINQTNAGCVLPREIRSDTCNAFYCESLSAYQKHAGERQEIGAVLAVQRAHTNWNRYESSFDNRIISITLLGQEES